MKVSEMNAAQKKACFNIKHAANDLLGGLENTMMDNAPGSEEYESAKRDLANHAALVGQLCTMVTTAIYGDGYCCFNPHAVMMNSVRGHDKTPGEFRKSQNWIGGLGSTIKNARYIPPNVQDMTECMSNLEKYINDENDETGPLVKAALLHYQFETIHPFLDGNGRVGHMLITLYLIQSRTISSPVLYLSCYLITNRIEYYDRMGEIRRAGNYEQWGKFFLRGIAATADDAIETIDKLTALRQKNEEAIVKTSERIRDRLAAPLRYIEQSPIIETVKTAEAMHCVYNTMAKDIKMFCDMGILKPAGKVGGSKTFAYDEYLDILRKDT